MRISEIASNNSFSNFPKRKSLRTSEGTRKVPSPRKSKVLPTTAINGQDPSQSAMKPIGPHGKKERKRTICLNSAYGRLRERIPGIQKDTKLSKIKILKLAKMYIQHLGACLENPNVGEFQFDLHMFKKNRTTAADLAAEGVTVSGSSSGRSTRGRGFESRNDSNTVSTCVSSVASVDKEDGQMRMVSNTVKLSKERKKEKEKGAKMNVFPRGLLLFFHFRM